MAKKCKESHKETCIAFTADGEYEFGSEKNRRFQNLRQQAMEVCMYTDFPDSITFHPTDDFFCHSASLQVHKQRK